MGKIFADAMKILSRVKERILKIDKRKFAEMFSGWNRNIQVNSGKEKFFVRIENGKISAKEGAIQKPQITIESDAETIEKILKEKISPLQAYSEGKLFITGNPDDLGMLVELVKRLGK